MEISNILTVTPALLRNIRPLDVSVLQNVRRTLIVPVAHSGRYYLKSLHGQSITPSGKYDFVTMPDGAVYVARQNSNFDYSTHLGLSGGRDVLFAGSIRFFNNTGPGRGHIVNWKNDSGHYQPPKSSAIYAGLPLGLFVEY